MAGKNADVLRFCTPARWWGEKWREGLYLGNGKIGANVYGGANEEQILINDATLSWLGRTTVVPDISDRIEETRRRIEEGDFLGAQTVIPTTLMQKSFRPQVEYPLPLCELDARFAQSEITMEFLRELDMEKGEATVRYSVGETRYKRNVFVSRADNLIAYRITKQGAGSISAQLSLKLMHRVNARTYEGICNMPEGVATKYDKQFMLFAARNEDNGTDYGVVAKLHVLGGSVHPQEDCVEIVNAQSVLILIKTFVNSLREREFNNLKEQLNLVKDGYEKLLKTHAAIHSKLYGSCDVRLSKSSSNIEDLLLETDSGKMPAELTEKLYKFSRYLTVAGTPDDGAPRLFTPCGLWNGSYKPYRASVTASGELQMTYMHTLQGNLSFNLEKTFDYYWNNVVDYRNNAQRIFGCRGIAVPVVAAPNTGRLGSLDLFVIHFSGCAAWVANLYYKYAKFSQNTKFLKNRLIPFMKDVALFYEDFFRMTDNGLEISPSALPMRIADSYNVTDRPVVAKNSALDYALAKDLLTNLIEACKTCNVRGSFGVWQKLIDAIPDKQLASDGTFREFVNSIISVDYTGVSNGTLYPAYFGEEVSFLSDEETKEHYIATADKKRSELASQNSYNMTVLGAVYARLGDGNKANLCLTNAARGCVINNLAFVDKDWRGMGICGSGVWTPIQLHVNLVFGHVVQQMLMYSRGDVIKIFPAISPDWKYVRFEGLLAENGVAVSVSMDGDKGTLSVKLDSKKETFVNLMLPDNVKKLTKTTLQVKPVGKNFDVTVPANKTVELQYKLK
ncbi:MAG: glycoside hydrolase N-terminal domain-containing protein [Clostridiales bacterium]|nr:glycoside hydrolase N-terminal domain-containing protein [Clostridiales bacterium]